MSQVVEVSLRLPVRAQVKSEAFPYGIADVRFTKTTDVDSVPKVGDSLTMSAGTLTFPCKVVQRTWDELDGIEHPRIWTAERDRLVWEALQG